MSTPTVHVIVEAEVLPAHTEEVKVTLTRLADFSRRETGCLAYEVLYDKERPTHMTITEIWSDASALNVHRASAHVAAALGSLEGKLAAAPVIHEFSPVQ